MKVAVLLSGGVDSSVALARLCAAGHDVTAYYLKIWLEQELHFLADCPWQEDLDYARAACDLLEVPLEVVALQTEYQGTVVAYTLCELRAGRTPSPDLLCNREIKFGAFLERHGQHFERVATGHYAQLRRVEQGFQLLRGADPVKDQSYFLAYLSDRQLAQAIFPIGGELKTTIREELEDEARKNSEGQPKASLLEKLIELNPFDAPKGLVAHQLRTLEHELRMQALYSGQDPRAMQFGEEQIAQLQDRATFAAKATLLLEAISEAQSIKVEEADMEARYQDIADARGQQVEAVRALFQKEDAVRDLELRLLEEKTLDWLMENSSIKGL